ncbi:MAG: hypothetical protein AAB475_01100 [Patescibacteria group bacterium]|mgnify:FL=1
MNFESKIKKHKGFAMLYAVLVSSILLSIGLAIFNLTVKELLLSSLGRDSQFAFYAADTGAECALYWDFQGDAFASSTPAANINCANEDRVVTSINLGGGAYRRTFEMDFSPEPYCTIVSVTKYDSPRRTIVEARGYNTCNIANPRRVERAIRATY